MIDDNREELFLLSDAPKRCRIRRRGRPPHVATFYRWAGRGAGGVKLETIRIGGALYTSEEAIARFIAAQNGTGDKPALPTHEQRRREETALSAVGI